MNQGKITVLQSLIAQARLLMNSVDAAMASAAADEHAALSEKLAAAMRDANSNKKAA